MAKGSKKAKAGRDKQKGAPLRQERRFTPRPLASGVVVQAVGGVGAAALGAGVWAQFGHAWMDNPNPPYSFAPALLAAGAIGFGAAVWLGTSGDAVVRVGAGGVGFESAKDVIRIPWYGVERVVWEQDRAAVTVNGKDESGRERHLVVTTKVQPGAVAWIVKEARARVPDLVDVPDEALGLPLATPGDGELLTMDPVQVVGRRCATSNRIIAYEPDARVCPRCERVYYKASVPAECECGASLTTLRQSDEAPPAKSSEDVARSESKETT